MSRPDTSAASRKRRNTVVFASTAVVVVLVVLLVISINSGFSVTGSQKTHPENTANSAAATAGASGTPKAVPSAPSVPLPPAEAKSAELNVKDFVAAAAKAAASPVATPSASDFKAVATGSAYDSMVANSEDFVNNGWHQEGLPTVVSVTVGGYQPSATPPEATLKVCVDSSKVNVLTADGSVVRKGTAADRSLNILTVVKSGGKWLVSRVSFPQDPKC